MFNWTVETLVACSEREREWGGGAICSLSVNKKETKRNQSLLLETSGADLSVKKEAVIKVRLTDSKFSHDKDFVYSSAKIRTKLKQQLVEQQAMPKKYQVALTKVAFSRVMADRKICFSAPVKDKLASCCVNLQTTCSVFTCTSSTRIVCKW